MTQLRFDPALYRLMSNFYWSTIFLHARTSEFKSISAKTRARFEMGDKDSLPCTFRSFHLDQGEGNTWSRIRIST